MTDFQYRFICLNLSESLPCLILEALQTVRTRWADANPMLFAIIGSTTYLIFETFL